MNGSDKTPVSLILDGGGCAQPDGIIEEISRRRRRVIWLSVRDGRKVACKGLPELLRQHPEEIAALRKEYLLTLRIDSPGVVSVYGFEEHPRLGPVIVMEYVDGVTLGEYLSGAGSRRRLSERRDLARAIAGAMTAAHAAGIAHRDLKPDNILVRTKDMLPKIIDFGHGDSDDFVVYKQSLGTDSYGAPEQREPSAAGIAADVYSLGKILDELLPERRFAALRRACKAEDPLQRPSMEQVLSRLGDSGNARRVAVAATAVVIAVALGVIFGVRHFAGGNSPTADAADTAVSAVSAPARVEPAEPAHDRQPALPESGVGSRAKTAVEHESAPAADTPTVDKIIGSYMLKADKINRKYGAITYALELKPDNDRRRMERAAEHYALADELDRELQQAGVDATGREEAKLKLWTHIVLQTNELDGVNEAREKIKRDYGISGAESE